MALMDIHPLGEGHVLIIPKQHAKLLQEVSAEHQAHMFELADKLVKAQRLSGFGTEGTNILINDGKAANQTVPHCHIHLIPRKKGDIIGSIIRVTLHITGLFGFASNRKALDAQASAIRSHLASMMPDN